MGGTKEEKEREGKGDKAPQLTFNCKMFSYV